MKTIALCIICKDENEDLKENMEYHTLLGVDHFIIYDNNSQNPLYDDFKDYKNVTVHPWKMKETGQQQKCYMNCINQYKNKFRWIGFIDTDEFIVIKNGITDIKKFLVPYEKYGGLGIQWKCFGSSGHLERQKSTIKNYIHTSGTGDDQHIKSIVNPILVTDTLNPHSFKYKKNFFCVNENMKRVPNAFNKPYTRDKIQLNHYVTRSREDFELKRKRGGGNTLNSKKLTEGFWNRFQNGTEETLIIDILYQLQKNKKVQTKTNCSIL
tara:strand:+ start:116 stop:916 length:801 start_codon:yes stop_codon:yes gene_type:complete